MNSLSGKFQITVGKKKFECHLSMNAFRMLAEKEDLSLEQVQLLLQHRPISAVPGILYMGVKNHFYFNSKPLDELPDYEYFTARILDDAEMLPKYIEHITKVYQGEEEVDEEDQEQGKK